MKLKKVYKDLLSEAITPATVEKTLMPHKMHARAQIQGEVEDYVNVLEFAVEYLAGHASANDEDFTRFMGWINKMTKRGLDDKMEPLKVKAAAVKKIEKTAKKKEPEEIELDASDVEPIDDEPKGATPPPLPAKKVTPPPPPEDAKPKFDAPKDAPSLNKLVGKPEDPEGDDIWAKAAARAAAHKPRGERMPSLSSLSGINPKLISVGAQIDVPGKQGVTVLRKVGGGWIVAKHGKKFLYEPGSGKVKPIRS